jgi:hypothetical protein
MEKYRDHGLEQCGLRQSCQRAVQFVQANAVSLLDTIRSAQDDNDELGLYLQLLQLPGLGYAKAGFFHQLVTSNGTIGCFDRHNMKMYGIDQKVFSRIPNTAELLELRASLYKETCVLAGGSCPMWNNWCAFIALKYPKFFLDAEHVSRYHVECITGESRDDTENSVGDTIPLTDEILWTN